MKLVRPRAVFVGSVAIVFVALGAIVAYASQSAGDELRPIGISPEDATRLPPAKAQFWADELDDLLTAQARPESDEVPYTPQLSTPLPLSEGIVDDVNSTFEFIFINGWGGTVDGKPIVVFAGRLKEDNGSGVLLITEPDVPAARTVLTTPIGTGALTIVAEDGPFLTVRDANGGDYTLDISNRVLINANGGTGTPVATPTSVETPLPQNSPIAP